MMCVYAQKAHGMRAHIGTNRKCTKTESKLKSKSTVIREYENFLIKSLAKKWHDITLRRIYSNFDKTHNEQYTVRYRIQQG